MLIAGVLHYRQSHERLARLIDSFVSPEGNTRVDAAVFLDGPFEGLSDIPGSGDETYKFIWDRCQAIGVQAYVFGPKIWKGEASKRTAAAQAAARVEWQPLAERRNEALGQERWYIVIDSDEWLESDVDWSLVEKQGTGTIILKSWRDGEWVDGEGDGSKMVRILPLLPTLVWGPAHYDVMDLTTGIVFLGHEKGLDAPNDPCVTFGHDIGTKTIAAEYEAYNDAARVRHEGKLLRIDGLSDDLSAVYIVMDRDQREADWIDGGLVQFPKEMMPDEWTGTEDKIYGMLTHTADVEDFPEVVRLTFTIISAEEHERQADQRQYLARLQRERDQALMQRREQKRARKRARNARRS